MSKSFSGVSIDVLAKHAANCRDKKRYATRKEAKNAARASEPYFGLPLHVYTCPVCDRFHITRNPNPSLCNLLDESTKL